MGFLQRPRDGGWLVSCVWPWSSSWHARRESDCMNLAQVLEASCVHKWRTLVSSRFRHDIQVTWAATRAAHADDMRSSTQKLACPCVSFRRKRLVRGSSSSFFLLLPAGQAEPADQLSQVRAALRLEEEVEVTFDSVSEGSG